MDLAAEGVCDATTRHCATLWPWTRQQRSARCMQAVRAHRMVWVVVLQCGRMALKNSTGWPRRNLSNLALCAGSTGLSITPELSEAWFTSVKDRPWLQPSGVELCAVEPSVKVRCRAGSAWRAAVSAIRRFHTLAPRAAVCFTLRALAHRYCLTLAQRMLVHEGL